MRATLVALALLSGCHTHEHKHHEDVQIRVNRENIATLIETVAKNLEIDSRNRAMIWDAIAEARTDANDAAEIWGLSCRVANLEVGQKYWKKAFRGVTDEHFDRIEILERVTGGRQKELEESLLELEEEQ
jgi:hypothetical protein